VNSAKNRDDEAAGWVERMNAPAPAPDVARAFDTWIAADPDHAERFGKMQLLWGSDAFVQALGRTAWQRPRQNPLHGFIAWLTRPLVLPAAGALACTAIAGVVALQSVTTETYSVAPGPAQRIALADGTRIVLSGGSRLEVRMAPWSRSATLARGQAFFDVAHERFRRFAIASGTTSINVLGTAFDVDREASDVVSVRVYRGLVGVESGNGGNWRAPAGTAIRVAGNKGAQLPGPRGSAPEWLDGWYETEGAPMAALVEQLNRFSAKPIALADPAIGRIRVSGRFRISETRMVLDALAATHDLRWREGDRSYRLASLKSVMLK
jgi:transmembrane sensor